MPGWFRKKIPQLITFPDNRAAFEYACSHLPNQVLLNALLPAIVEEEGRRGSDGERWYQVRLASKTGGMAIWGCTLKDAPGQPAIGDLVGFRIVRIADELPPDMNIVGYIACRLEPAHLPGKGWRVAESFTPANLKPALHL